jgi:hypothetical protein
MAEDITFHNLDRGHTKAGTWYDKDRDAKAWQDEDEDSEAGNWR